MFKKFIQIWHKVTKRQKFIVGVAFLSLVLFISEHLFSKSSIYIVFFISFLTDLFLFWAVREDLKENFFPQVLILPFSYSLSFSLFYFLVPGRFLTRILMTSLYAFGLYSLFLSQNIFIVSSIRTIALLASARTVSLIITLLSYFFIMNVIFSLHLNAFFTLFLIFTASFPLILQSIWTYSLNKRLLADIAWVAVLTLCLTEIASILWFWPVIPTIIGLFLAGFFYITVGLSHVWLDKRLFKSVMWEYIWVAVIVFSVFTFFSFKS